jgi:UDP-N-acetyl-D-glucosamine dehydrogenase
VLGIGVAFKPEVDDLRGSPSLEVLERLAASGADVRYHDAYVPEVTLAGTVRRSVPLTPQEIEAADIAVILTPHVGIDIHAVVGRARLVFDARGVTSGIDAPHVDRL